MDKNTIEKEVIELSQSFCSFIQDDDSLSRDVLRAYRVKALEEATKLVQAKIISSELKQIANDFMRNLND